MIYIERLVSADDGLYQIIWKFVLVCSFELQSVFHWILDLTA
uniref:Uncharacterized protein n=1 Tax=Arundo donax TaxID=35708 RepID=A0A0A9FCT3_ARUDO